MTAVDAFLRTAGVPLAESAAMFNAWPAATPENLAERVTSIGQFAVGEDPDWPIRQDPLGRIKDGIYSPIQLLLAAATRAKEAETDLEYPFGFSPISLATDVLAQTMGTGVADLCKDWPTIPSMRYATTRKLIQSLFQQREVREEGQAPSLEMLVPLAPDNNDFPTVRAKKLGQVFGRGVAMVQGSGLTKLPSEGGQVVEMFENHSTAPSSLLYGLKDAFTHLPEKKLSLALKRDGVVTIAMDKNPILEFYNGGWHVCDLKYARLALTNLAVAAFGADLRPEIIPRILSLAYHMASHWHSGIVGIVPPAVADSQDTQHVAFEAQGDESKEVRAAIAALKAKKGDPDLKIDSLGNAGFGRLLFSAGLQDGATLLTPDGTFHSAGRMVEKIGAGSEGGAGARAAKEIGAAGLAIKISMDGAIKVYCTRGNAKTPLDGLRIH